MANFLDTDVWTTLVRARTALILDEPFFGQLIMNLELYENTGIKTMCVGRNKIQYSPDFVKTLDSNVTKSALAHEVGHCVLDTFGRRKHRNPKGWNYATDYKINQMLEEAGFTLGDGWLRNKAYDDMSAEEIYELLPQNDGSGPGTGDPGGPMDDMDDSPPEPGEPDMTPTDWKTAVIQAATEAKARGKLPASMERFVDRIVNPRVDWEGYLARFATERSRNDYSWSRPNKRLMQYGIYMPRMYSENMGTMAVIIDTSGSISQVILNAFGAEITAIHQKMRPEKLYVIYCDADVNHVDEYGPSDVLKFEMHGGGGTDFRPPFAYLDEKGITPACGVYLTDMYGTFPKDPAMFPFLWCATSDIKGPWGDTVHVEI